MNETLNEASSGKVLKNWEDEKNAVYSGSSADGKDWE